MLADQVHEALLKLTGQAPKPAKLGFTSACPLCKKPNVFWYVAKSMGEPGVNTKSHCGCSPDSVLAAIEAATSTKDKKSVAVLGKQTVLPLPAHVTTPSPSPAGVELRQLSDPAIADMLHRLANAIMREPL